MFTTELYYDSHGALTATLADCFIGGSSFTKRTDLPLVRVDLGSEGIWLVTAVPVPARKTQVSRTSQKTSQLTKALTLSLNGLITGGSKERFYKASISYNSSTNPLWFSKITESDKPLDDFWVICPNVDKHLNNNEVAYNSIMPGFYIGVRKTTSKLAVSRPTEAFTVKKGKAVYHFSINIIGTRIISGVDFISHENAKRIVGDILKYTDFSNVPELALVLEGGWS